MGEKETRQRARDAAVTFESARFEVIADLAVAQERIDGITRLREATEERIAQIRADLDTEIAARRDEHRRQWAAARRQGWTVRALQSLQYRPPARGRVAQPGKNEQPRPTA